MSIHKHLARLANVLAFCVMPDHVHLLLSVRELNLIDAVARWKRAAHFTTRRHLDVEQVWQRSSYDEGIRVEAAIEPVADYIVNNPVRAGLVSEWPEWIPRCWHRWMGDAGR